MKFLFLGVPLAVANELMATFVWDKEKHLKRMTI